MEYCRHLQPPCRLVFKRRYGDYYRQRARELFGPVAIDPSVVDSAASNFMNNGNNESDITYDTTNNQVIEANLDGGSIGASWTATTFSTSGPVMPARFAFGASPITVICT